MPGSNSNRSILTAFSGLAHQGTRRQSILLQKKRDDSRYTRECVTLRDWVDHPGLELHLTELRRQRDEHKRLRAKDFEKHLSMVGHTAWEAAMDYAIDLLEGYKSFQLVGQAEEED